MQIPSFLLRKLYVKGSLVNVDGGFEFKIKNSLSPGTAIEIMPIKVNDTEYGLDATIIKTEGAEMAASEVTEENAFPIKVGVEIQLFVKGDALAAGEHKIDIGIKTKEAGTLAFDVKDTI